MGKKTVEQLTKQAMIAYCLGIDEDSVEPMSERETIAYCLGIDEDSFKISSPEEAIEKDKKLFDYTDEQSRAIGGLADDLMMLSGLEFGRVIASGTTMWALYAEMISDLRGARSVASIEQIERHYGQLMELLPGAKKFSSYCRKAINS